MTDSPRRTSLLREPLVHFVLIGGALFAIDALRAPTEHAPPPVVPAPRAPAGADAGVTAPRSIVIDADARAQIAANAERRLGRAASPEELAQETERWIDEEILYREAIARGLDANDPVIHQRIAARMAYVLEQALVMPEPSEAELRAWFEQHREQWSVAERVDFTHVFVAGSDAAAETRASELANALAGGAAPERLGDRFSGGHKYRGRKLADLSQAFGEEFAAGLDRQLPGTWVRRRSRHGLHVVRVDRIDSPRAADFAAARLDVRKAWLDAKRAELLAAAMKQLRTRWTIERRG